MAGLTTVASLPHALDAAAKTPTSQHRVTTAATSSEDRQHLRDWSAEHAAFGDVAGIGPVKPDSRRDLPVFRKAVRSVTVSSACSTAYADSQPDLEHFSWDGDTSLAGQVRVLSQDREGSRQVQAALEAAPSEEAREVLAEELHGHVAKAMRCPHANHALQKCIAMMRPRALQFIVDELLAREGLAVQAAKHRYAHRIVQHTLRKCPPSQTAELVEALLRDAKVLACHAIGHYTIELLLGLGTEEQRYRLIRLVEQNARSIGLTTVGGGVVHTALSCAAAEDKIWIARAVVQDPEVLLSLATHRQGSTAVVQVLQALQDRERDGARALLLRQVGALRASSFGRVVIEHLLSSEILA